MLYDVHVIVKIAESSPKLWYILHETPLKYNIQQEVCLKLFI